MQRLFLFAAFVVLVLLSLSLSRPQPAATAADPQPAAKPDDAALARTRKMVQTLDSVYKQTIVLITDKYVHTENDFPAGSAAVLLFRKISAGGSHSVRLIDATGQPYEPKNVAADDFEKEGVKRLKSGEAYFDKVVEQDGKPRLRAITPVPVVMKKCIMCHAHYADAKKGEPIGAITYSIPIE